MTTMALFGALPLAPERTSLPSPSGGRGQGHPVKTVAEPHTLFFNDESRRLSRG